MSSLTPRRRSTLYWLALPALLVASTLGLWLTGAVDPPSFVRDFVATLFK